VLRPDGAFALVFFATLSLFASVTLLATLTPVLPARAFESAFRVLAGWAIATRAGPFCALVRALLTPTRERARPEVPVAAAAIGATCAIDGLPESAKGTTGSAG
jgi:hypothetical protein